MAYLCRVLQLDGAIGLAFASDIGIALQTVTIAVLLHRRHMVSLASLDYAEMGRCLLAALASGAGVWIAVWGYHQPAGHLPGNPLLRHGRVDRSGSAGGRDLQSGWRLPKMVLEKSGSALPRVAMKRLGLA